MIPPLWEHFGNGICPKPCGNVSQMRTVIAAKGDQLHKMLMDLEWEFWVKYVEEFLYTCSNANNALLLTIAFHHCEFLCAVC